MDDKKVGSAPSTAKTSSTNRAGQTESEAEGADAAESSDSAEQSEWMTSAIREGADRAREFMGDVIGATPLGASGSESSSAEGAESVSALELQADAGGGDDRVGELENALAGRTSEIRENEVRDQWFDDYGADALGELTDREPEQWRSTYNRSVNHEQQELREAVQVAVGSGDEPLSNDEIREAVDAHREQLEAEGAFEGWGERDIKNWEKGVVEFAKNQRARSKLDSFQPGKAAVQSPRVGDDEITVDAPEDEIVEKLDSWEEEQLDEIDSIKQNLEGELEADEQRKIDDMKEDVREARDMYEEVTVGDKYLPEVVPKTAEGIGKQDDLQAEEFRENPGLDEDLVPVREPYVEHLQNNPGDLVGAYEVVQERTENARWFRAAVEGAPT